MFSVDNDTTATWIKTVDLSAIAILKPRVRIPSTPSTLFQLKWWKLKLYLLLEWDRNENKQKRGRDRPLSLKKLKGVSICFQFRRRAWAIFGFTSRRPFRRATAPSSSAPSPWRTIGCTRSSGIAATTKSSGSSPARSLRWRPSFWRATTLA